MNTDLKSYKVTIFGSQYTLMSDENQSDLMESALALDTMMKEIAAKYSSQNQQTIAILAALKVVHQLRTTQAELTAEHQAQNALIKHIDASLRMISSTI